MLSCSLTSPKTEMTEAFAILSTLPRKSSKPRAKTTRTYYYRCICFGEKVKSASKNPHRADTDFEKYEILAPAKRPEGLEKRIGKSKTLLRE